MKSTNVQEAAISVNDQKNLWITGGSSIATTYGKSKKGDPAGNSQSHICNNLYV